jgi:hypothetical protein
MTLTFAQPPTATPAPPQGLAARILTDQIDVIHDFSAGSARSQQTLIGPSELGHPCTRQIAYKMLGWPTSNTSGESWYAIVGTAVHKWLTDAHNAANQALGRQRWITDRRLNIGAGIVCPRGSGDLYDTDHDLVIDWKIPGNSSLAATRRHGPGPTYETQLHLYGFGWERLGFQPKHVANVFLPRSPSAPGNLASLAKDAHVWVAPYQRDKAIAALTRGRAITDTILALDPEKNPEAWGLFPAVPEKCDWCPFYAPGSRDLSKGCPGTTQTT